MFKKKTPEQINREKWRKFSSRIIRYVALLVLFLGVFAACFDFSYKYAMKTEENRLVLEQAEGMEVIDGEEIMIPYDSTTTSIANLLKEAGYIDNVAMFRLLSKINGYDGQYQAGYHIISKRMNYNELMFTLTQDAITVTVMIPEGYSIDQIADLLEKNKVCPKEEFLRAVEEEVWTYKFLQDIPDGKDRLLEGFLYPDTYFFTVGSNGRTVLNKFLSNFENKFKNKYYTQMEKLGLDINEVLTLASIVEKESSSSSERRIIAGVLYKRMNETSGSLTKLQSCATIQYIAYRDTGKLKDVIYNSDTLIDDPYNTYLNAGLPPGPICNPSIDAILAVLDMDKDTPYWYFCATGKGSSVFAKTYNEHMANVKKYNYIVSD